MGAIFPASVVSVLLPVRGAKSPIPLAVLVGIQAPDDDDVAHEASLEELGRPVKTLGYDVIGVIPALPGPRAFRRIVGGDEAPCHEALGLTEWVPFSQLRLYPCYFPSVETRSPIPLAVLVGIQAPVDDDVAHEASLEELGRLVKTLGYDIIGTVSQKSRRSPRTNRRCRRPVRPVHS